LADIGHNKKQERMTESPNALCEKALALISENVSEQQYNTWFKPIAFESFNEQTKTVLVQVPSPFVYEYLEENYVGLFSKVLRRVFCEGVRLTYRVVTDREHSLSQNFEAEQPEAPTEQPKRRANQSPSVLDAALPQ
jgi:chromosomal replication initiator protein